MQISTPAAIGILAGVIVLSSAASAGAAGYITGAQIKDGTVTGADIKDSSLTGLDIKDSSLTGADIKNGSITAADLAPTAVSLPINSVVLLPFYVMCPIGLTDKGFVRLDTGSGDPLYRLDITRNISGAVTDVQLARNLSTGNQYRVCTNAILG